MSYKQKHGSYTVNSSVKTAKIPLSLALALQNESSKPVRANIPVLDDSMFPTILTNTHITVEQVLDASTVEADHLYFIVDNNLRGFLRRVTLLPDEDYLRLYCDHPDKALWPAYWMRISSIRAIFKVLL